MNIKKKSMLIKSIIMFVIAMPIVWGILYPLLCPLSPVWRDTIKYLVTAFMTLLLMRAFFQKKLFTLKNTKLVHSLFSFGLLGLIGAVGAFIFSYEPLNGSITIESILGCIALNLAIAVSEEFLFRGVILNALLDAYDQKGGKSGLWKAVIIANVIFGLRHLLNLIQMPGAVIGTLAQVIFTAMAGTYLCAVYLRSNNLWTCIIIHFLEDFASSFWTINQWNAAGNSDISIGTGFAMIAMQIPYVIFAVLMLNDKRWSR